MVRISLAPIIVVALLAASACPGPRELDGLACDESGACDEGFTCRDGKCFAIPVCGNGTRDPLEECEGDDLNGVGCPAGSLGSAVCTATCEIDRSGCSVTCGDGVRGGGELCDDGNVRPDDLCSADCAQESIPLLESEPNDDGSPAPDSDDFLASAANGPLTGDALVAGEVVAGDQDAWAIASESGGAVAVSIHGREGIGSCGTSVDFRVREANGATLFEVGGGANSGCPLQTFALEAGRTIYLEAFSHESGGSYLLAVDFSP